LLYYLFSVFPFALDSVLDLTMLSAIESISASFFAADLVSVLALTSTLDLVSSFTSALTYALDSTLVLTCVEAAKVEDVLASSFVAYTP
jgi:hypothetical protein